MHRKNWSRKYDIEFVGNFLWNILCFICAATSIYEVCKVISSVIRELRFKHFTCSIFYFYFLRKGRGRGGGGSKKWGNEKGAWEGDRNVSRRNKALGQENGIISEVRATSRGFDSDSNKLVVFKGGVTKSESLSDQRKNTYTKTSKLQEGISIERNIAEWVRELGS